ncbi:MULTISPECIES: hypothetical protein [unclassified Bacillus (in: firmicutes)]|uniref:hypothetical protein n=1 Tax=unclassified Bacillus (in: firmicutes) TaxID=185979 RepID=UPI0038380BF3
MIIRVMKRIIKLIQAKKIIKERYITSSVVTIFKVDKFEYGYAAVSQEHIHLFKYDKEKEDVVRVQAYQLAEFDRVTIEHFAFKTLMKFIGTNRTFIFTPMQHFKGIEHLIHSIPSIQVVTIKRIWFRKIIGFRSLHKWKMSLAVIGYILISVMSINLIMNEGESDSKKEKQTLTANQQILENRIKSVVDQVIGQKRLIKLEIKKDMNSKEADKQIINLSLQSREGVTFSDIKHSILDDTANMLYNLASDRGINQINFSWKLPPITENTSLRNNALKITFDYKGIQKYRHGAGNEKELTKIAIRYWSHPSLDE